MKLFGFKDKQKTLPAPNDERFTDNVSSLTNALINNRQAMNVNRFTSNRLDYEEMKEIFKTGVARRIFKIKSGYALKGEMDFEGGSTDKDYFQRKLMPIIREVAQWQLGFGRGIIAVGNRGDDLSQPLTSSFNPERAQFYPFSGDMISSGNISLDLESERYYKPVFYIVRGYRIHWTRVIDFTYVKPVESDSPDYRYGGISESELIYGQLINDGIIQRANATIIEKASNLFYKLTGFKQLLQTKQTSTAVAYFASLERLRGIYGAGIIDSEDAVENVTQQINGLKEMDDVSLRRLGMVTGIPVPMLVGENVKGLNSAGDTEREVFNEMLEDFREDYLIHPINQLMTILGRGSVSFKKNQGYNPAEKASYESKILDNALKLMNLGEDHTKYLEDKGIIKEDAVADFFKIEE